MATSSALTMSATTARMSASPKPRVVNGGVPKRMPLGFSALLSPGTVFLFTEMPTSSRILGRRREAFASQRQGDPEGLGLGYVDLAFGSALGWWATTVATTSYCPSRMMEHAIPISTQPRAETF